MPSYSTNLVTDTLQVNEILTPVETKNITSDGTIQAENITSTGVINWNSFNPPITGGGGTPGLTLVLGTGNNAGTQDINDLSSLTFQKNAGDPISGIVGDSVNTTQCYHLDLSDASNTFPGSLAGDLEATLQLGNTANGQSITGLSGLSLNASATVQGNATNKAVVTNCDLSSATNVFPPSLNEDIEGTLIAGNNANGQDLTGVNGLGCTGLQATSVSAQAINAGALTIDSDANPLSGILNLNVSAQNETVKLDFTGTAQNTDQDTEISGDTTLINGQPKLTKCTYLDLTSATNRIPEQGQDYTWGVVYAPTTQVLKDFDDSSGVFDENCYFDWSSTNPEHSTCIVDCTFFIKEFGYGSISLSLHYGQTSQSPTRGLYPNSTLNYVPEESATAFRSVRKVGQCHVQFIIDNLNTDGTSYRFWLFADTDFNDAGRMIVAMRRQGGSFNIEGDIGAPVTCLMRPFPSRVRRAS